MTDLPTFRLDGKVALVTGASSGLGLRFGKVLAKAGAKVVLAARRTDRLRDLEREIEADGGKAISVALDVTKSASVIDSFEAAEGSFGPVDILINNAGMNFESRAVDMPETEYDKMMDTNVKGAFLMAQQAGKRMIARKAPGRIVNVASIGALRVLPGLAVYCMSKAAIAMMTQVLAREWASRQINVNAMCPGFIETELNSDWFSRDAGKAQIASFPRRRLGVEEDLDGTLLLLCSEAGRLITGSLFTVDDGQSL
ncbi:MAG: glucose 1-dehydrogenase [Alphaproteobacteria bacterium]|nr:glucose 1-dehydrogenase [Alphaproteobacteria bacterium]